MLCVWGGGSLTGWIWKLRHDDDDDMKLFYRETLRENWVKFSENVLSLLRRSSLESLSHFMCKWIYIRWHWMLLTFTPIYSFNSICWCSLATSLGNDITVIGRLGISTFLLSSPFPQSCNDVRLRVAAHFLIMPMYIHEGL